MTGVWDDWKSLYILYGHSKPIVSVEQRRNALSKVTLGRCVGWKRADALLIIRRQEDF